MRRLLAAATWTLLLPAMLSAQTLRRQTRVLPYDPSSPSQVISVNPFLPLFGFFQGEYEQRINPNASFAISGSHNDWDNDTYNNLDVKLRLYPEEHALMGLGVAAGVGFANIDKAQQNDCIFGDLQCVASPRKTLNVPTFSIEGSYQWLLGMHRATAVTAGFGVKRYFGSDEDFRGTSRVLPTGRLTIGYAF